MTGNQEFTDEQKQYLQGFAAGSGLNRSLPVLGQQATWARTLGASEEVVAGPDALQRAAQDRFTAAGKKLTPEENAKRTLVGLDIWDEMLRHARDARFPKGTDVLLFKFQGMFYVAPAQNSFMCRLRFAGGLISSTQLRGVANLAEQFGGGYVDATTRANLQIREIGPKHTVDVLTGLHDLGIINRGSGADNIRNVTASATAGLDPDELIDTRPLARQMHHYILNHREMYGLPRKFNIAFDGGGSISALEDTNDIGFVAVRSGDEIGFRMQLGGITGHQDFARDTGVLLTPGECVEVAAAVVRVFIDHGDRTDRKKARLKYVLDAWGFDKFMAETERVLGRTLRRVPLEKCQSRTADANRTAHVGVHAQKQQGLNYIGIVLPVGRLTCEQARGLSRIADRFGTGELRLTVWQNLLIPNIPAEHVEEAKRQIESLGLHWSATNIRAGLIACTGSAGCKFAAANTKAHAMLLAASLEQRIQLDDPINIHFTGCHNSCAQHFIGDIGLIGTKLAVGEDMVEGYHIFVGGGYGARQQIGREMHRDVRAEQVPAVVEQMLRAFQENRTDTDQTFQDFVARNSTEQLRELFQQTAVNL